MRLSRRRGGSRQGPRLHLLHRFDIRPHRGRSAQPPAPLLADLGITPAGVEPGNVVAVNFAIANSDGQVFIYAAAMRMGGLALLIGVELGAYESKAVSQTMALDAVGGFIVTVDGLAGGFVAKPSLFPLRLAEFVVSGLFASPVEVEGGECGDIRFARVSGGGRGS